MNRLLLIAVCIAFLHTASASSFRVEDAPPNMARCGRIGPTHSLSPPPFVNASATAFGNDLLIVTLAVPYVYQTLGINFYGPGAQPSCPGDSGWTPVYFDPILCLVVYQNPISWVQATTPSTSCGFTPTDIDTNVFFDGLFNVKTTETYITDDGDYKTREYDVPLHVGVNFMTQIPVTNYIVDVSLNFTAWDLGNLTINQTTTPPFGTLGLNVLTMWPLYFKNPRMTYNPSDIVTTVAFSSQQCNDDYKPCAQTFMLFMSPSAQRCNLNGSYFVEFDVACQTLAPAGFCDTFSTVLVQIKDLVTDNYCTTPTVYVLASGTLGSYVDSKYTEKAQYFVQDSWVYNLLTGISQQATVTSVTTANVTLKIFGRPDIDLYLNGQVTPDGQTAMIAVTDSAGLLLPAEAHIDFMLSDQLVPVTRKTVLTVEVVVDAFISLDNVKKSLSVSSLYQARASDNAPIPVSIPPSNFYFRFASPAAGPIPLQPSSSGSNGPSTPGATSAQNGAQSSTGSSSSGRHTNASASMFASLYSTILPIVFLFGFFGLIHHV